MKDYHGHAQKAGRSPTYNTWLGMRERCYNPHNVRYALYGARGIRVCTAWQTFSNFLADMGEKPVGYTLDRINPDEDYFPENCRWATYTEQNLNLRTRKDNTSGLKGVSFNKNTGKWRALGSKAGIRYSLYYGDSFEAACDARLLWEEAL